MTTDRRDSSKTHKNDSKNIDKQKQHENQFHIINVKPSYRPRKLELFDELIEVGSCLHLYSIHI